MAGHPAFPGGYQGGGVKYIDRRKFLVRSGLAAGVAAAFPAPAIAQGIRELKLVTSWPKGPVEMRALLSGAVHSLSMKGKK